MSKANNKPSKAELKRALAVVRTNNSIRENERLNNRTTRPTDYSVPKLNGKTERLLDKGEAKRLMKELVLEAPKAEKGSALYKMYKLFQTRDARLLEQALGCLMRYLDPYKYFSIPNLSIGAFVRSILARSRFCQGLKLIDMGVGNDKYCFVKFNPDNPLAPISILKEKSLTYYSEIPAIKDGDGAGCNFENDATVIIGTPTGTLSAAPPTAFTPVVHTGRISGSTTGDLIGLTPAANKKEITFTAPDGSSTGLQPQSVLKGKYAGMLAVKPGDSIGVNIVIQFSATIRFNVLWLLNTGALVWGTEATAAASTVTSLSAGVAPANAVAGWPVVWTSGTSSGNQSVVYLQFIVVSASWMWEQQYGDYANDVYEQMLNYCVNGYKFVITPENADAYKSGYTQIVRVPYRSHYTAPRDPVSYWNAIRQTQGLEQRSASMAGSGAQGEGVSGVLPFGGTNDKLWSRSDLPTPYESTIFAFRQPAVTGGTVFQDTTMEISIEYAYQYQPALYNQQNVAQYYPYNPQAEALAQSVMCKLDWFTCNPDHSIFEKAAGWIGDAKNKLVAYGAEHPDVAPKVMAALTAIGMSFL